MTLDRRLIPNSSDIVFEKFENEVVLINLKTGLYYNLNETGTLTWELLLMGLPPGRVLSGFEKHVPGSSDSFKKDIEYFIDGLVEEGLLVYESEQIDESELPVERSYEHLFTTVKSTPEVPIIEKYSDQRELLLLDPIHEVSDLGWPDPEKKPGNE